LHLLPHHYVVNMCETDVEWHLNEVSTRWSIDNLLGAFVTRDAMHIREEEEEEEEAFILCKINKAE